MIRLSLCLLTLLSAEALACSEPPVPPPRLRWTKLLDRTDAVCDMWVVGVEEVNPSARETLSCSELRLRSPPGAPAKRLGHVSRFAHIEWLWSQGPALDSHGVRWYVFLRQLAERGAERWNLATRPQGAWQVDILRGSSLSDAPVPSFPPTRWAYLLGLPAELYEHREFFVSAHRWYSLSFCADVVTPFGLDRWFGERASSSEGSP